jgi:glycosyltransferase involved in cell wall biosynthesis
MQIVFTDTVKLKLLHKVMMMALPKITVGMPVYNGEDTLRPVLDSLLAQSFSDFELVISDNASMDDTANICQEYAAKDSRIRYVRQEKNLGGIGNFKFVFDEAQCEYFMWAASDDIRSPDFIELNYTFLSENPDYVASTSPNGFENWPSERELVRFALVGHVFDRYITFFKYSYLSHGIFYSLFRTQILRRCELIDNIFPGFDWLAFDWALNLFLASKGKINRTQNGYTIFGVTGISSNVDIYKKFNKSPIEWFLPFYRLSGFVLDLTRSLEYWQRVWIIIILAKLNILAKAQMLRRSLHIFLRRIQKSFL